MTRNHHDETVHHNDDVEETPVEKEEEEEWRPSELVDNHDSDDATFYDYHDSEDEEEEEEEDWIPDREKVRQIRQEMVGGPYKSAQVTPHDLLSSFASTRSNVVRDQVPGRKEKQQQQQKQQQPTIGLKNDMDNDNKNHNDNDYNTKARKTPFVYTDEEEELIAAMGGKSDKARGTTTTNNNNNNNNKREEGFLGDCTLKEISMDYAIPICYLADVLATWGVPVPIDVHSRLGDLVTGEQAFAILEAIHTLDVASLHDRYSDYDLLTVCAEYEIELKDAFDMAVREGWNLPFGVRTFLRVEQEDELIRVLGDEM